MRKILALAVCVITISVCAAFAFERATSSQNSQQQNQPHIERTATVSYVVDGDTIHLEGDEKVRMAGVNAPELRSNNPNEIRRAYEAKEFVENLCPVGITIGLDVDDLKRKDRYGRTLAVVYVNVNGSWINLNAELLRNGYAEILFIPPSEFNPYKWLDR
jgi:micrococcal nuclease